MVDKRNRILELVSYIESLGVVVNLGKTKARGNKGFFKTNGLSYRIDIRKGLDDGDVLGILLHEFAHFIHFSYDKTLKSLDFLQLELDDGIFDEMIELTVNSISKSEAENLFITKEKLQKEIKSLVSDIKKDFPDFKMSDPNKKIELVIKKKGFGYLLKHDRVKVFNGFGFRLYSIDDLDSYFNNDDLSLKNYILLKSKKRYLNRINSKISKLNNYYNSNTELFARAFEAYFNNSLVMQTKAPVLYSKFNEIISKNKIEMFTRCAEILF